jgi:hypothetical protein
VQDRGFGSVGENMVSIHVLEVFDMVLPKPTRGTEVKILGVFISVDTIFNFHSLPPIGDPVVILFAKVNLGKGAQVVLKRGEVAIFLQPVEEGDHISVIEQIDGGKPAFLDPSTGS